MSDNCKYCHMEPNGNIPEDRKDIFKLEIMELFGRPFILCGAILGDKLGFTDNFNCASKEIKIKFCPMCGRKLMKEVFNCKSHVE